ncbi:O-antigen ligase family protein [Nitrospinae bacterium]|nr:O-antigen ligase family protein [Nitrospinota bacterium]
MKKFSPDTNSSEVNHMVPLLDKVIQFSLFTFVAFSMFSISVTQISFAIGAIASLLKTHLTKSWKELRGTYVGSAVLFFCLACFFSTITAVDFESSLKLLKKLLQFIILFWVANAVQDKKQRDLLFKLVIVAGLATALNALLPFISPCTKSFHYCGEYYGERAIGTMSVPSTFSGILMFTGLAALSRLLFHKPKEYWVLGSVGIISLCLLMSLTRQAWLGFSIGTIFLLFFWNKKYLLIIPVLLVSIFLFSGDNVEINRIIDRIHSFANLKDSSLQARVFLWKGGWEIFKDHPVTGCGYKCVDSIYSQYSDPSGLIAHYRGLHSNIFQLLIDTGIVGLGFWICIWMTYFVETFKRLRSIATEASQNNSTSILMGASAAVIAFLVGGFFESSLYDSEVTMLLYFLMGLSLAQIKVTSEVK